MITLTSLCPHRYTSRDEETLSDNSSAVIDNPRLLGALRGHNDSNLEEISALLSFPIRTRGNEIFLIMLDEAQNTTVEQMKMFLYPPGGGSGSRLPAILLRSICPV